MKKIFRAPKNIPGLGEVGKDGKSNKVIFGSTHDVKTDLVKGNPYVKPNNVIKKLYGGN